VNGNALDGESPIVKLCFAGAAAPTTALNEIALEDAVSISAGAPVIVSVTGISSGELFTVCPPEFGAVIVTITCPENVPAARPAVFTHALIFSCVCPAVGVTVSHATSVLIATGNGPAGVVSSTFTVWHAGEEPAAPENASDVGTGTKTHGLVVTAAVPVPLNFTDILDPLFGVNVSVPL
jgi:hypothetical protein